MRPEERGRDEETDTESVEVPWLAVTAAEVPGLVAAYRQARTLALVVGALLMASGVPTGELPVLVAAVNAEGLPVVLVRRCTGNSDARTGAPAHEHHR